MNVVLSNLDEEKILKIIDFYASQKVNNNNEYVRFAAKGENFTVLIYTTGKVMFQGSNAEYEASIWGKADQKVDKLSKTDHKMHINAPILPQAGSDEVGTGDYFGPVCVCASYIDEEIYSKIKQFAIDDSKKLTDTYIRKIGKELDELVPHSLLILNNEKYNVIHNTTNLNAIKAKMHNSCWLHLNEKVKLPKLCMVDQFAEEPIYYNYLRNEAKVYRNLQFETHSESNYISVAASSIIARYAFLKYMDKLNEDYGLEFPKGGGQTVNEFIPKFIEKFGYDELNKVAKLHFKNTPEKKSND